MRGSAQNTISVLDCGEAIVNVPHIPVKVLHASVTTDVLEEGIQHLPL